MCKGRGTIFMNYNIILFLARNFGSVQGVYLPDTGYVLSYIEDVRTGKNNAVITRNIRQKLDFSNPDSIKCACTILLFCKKIKKLSPYPTGVYINFQNFFRRFSHKTRRYVQVWRDCFSERPALSEHRESNGPGYLKTKYCYIAQEKNKAKSQVNVCLLYTSPSPRDRQKCRMPSSA